MSLRIDVSEFKNNMKNFKSKHPKMIERVLVKTAQQVKIDADEIPPKTPHDEGTLRGNVEIRALKYFMVMIWYMTVYAARHHEADPPFNWKETGVGAKFLEIKLSTYNEKYGKLMAALHRVEVNNA